MRLTLKYFLVLMLLALPFSGAMADEYEDTLKVFKNAGESGNFFGNSYGYALFPTIGKGGIDTAAAGSMSKANMSAIPK